MTKIVNFDVTLTLTPHAQCQLKNIETTIQESLPSDRIAGPGRGGAQLIQGAVRF